jgi:hypothetical protein
MRVHGLVLIAIVAAMVTPRAATLDAAAADADRGFVKSVDAGDAKGTAVLLDDAFTWTTAEGQTLDRAHVKQALPKPVIGDESSAQTTTYSYGSVGVVEVNSAKLHTLRIWVKRPQGWRLLVYQDVKSLDAAPAASVKPAATAKCENPCGAVPYSPKSAVEKEVMTAYTSLEEAAMGGKAKEWSEVAADEIALVSSLSDRAFDKTTRAAAIAKATLGSVRPTKLLSARLFEFGNAVVMTSQHQADNGQHLQITRVWVKRDNRWQETLSYQTAAHS